VTAADPWTSILVPEAEQPEGPPAVWEVFHENSKTTRYATVMPNDVVAARMERMHPSLVHRGVPAVDLPPAAPVLAGAAQARRSARELDPVPIPVGDLATLLDAAYGVTAANADNGYPRPFRAVPSGGALYPLELYVAVQAAAGIDPGLHHLEPGARRLEHLDPGLTAEALAGAFVQPEVILGSAVVVLLGALFERSTFKYGERGYRFVLIEAGHVAQNLTLAATELGYASVCLGGYFDHEVDALVGLDGVTSSIVYAIAIGGRAS
jgi:SagB-type dehydrogenase family enzyme